MYLTRLDKSVYGLSDAKNQIKKDLLNGLMVMIRDMYLDLKDQEQVKQHWPNKV